jgi:hypothetical protein
MTVKRLFAQFLQSNVMWAAEGRDGAEEAKKIQ